jgi:predicted TIM-barrel fold metal-dependent hydrolase
VGASAVVLEPFIDAHSHIWTPDVGHYPLAKGFTVADMKPPSFTAEQLLGHCRPAGVGRVNLIQMSFYEFDNSYMLDMIKLYPERFVGTAIVDPLGPHPDEAMRALLPKGVRAFRIAPNYSKLPPARWLEPPGYAAMFAAAAETGQALSCLINPDAFPEVDRMCRKFPETPVIIDHLGRIGVDGEIRPADVEALCALARHPRMYVKVGAFYALGKKTPPYDDLAPLIHSTVQAFGANRCMWESDCPFQVDNHRYIDSVALIRDRLDFLSKEDRDWLLRKTAEGLLFAAR